MNKHKPGQGGSRSNDPQNQGQNNQRRVTGEISVSGKVETNLPPNLLEEYTTSNVQTNTRENKRYIVEVITLFLVMAAASVSLIQASLSRESLKESRDLFVRDQKPYVHVTEISRAHIGPPDNRLESDVNFSNYGKSPALRLTRMSAIFDGESSGKQADEWFKKMGTGTLEDANKRDDIQRTILYEIDLMQAEKGGNPVVGMTTGITDPLIPYVVVERVQYFDGFGNRYWSDMCAFHVKGDNDGPMVRCFKHNRIHQEGEKDSSE